MSSTSFFSPEYDCKYFHFENNQEGYFYDFKLNNLIEGKIINHRLNGTVVHDGSTSNSFPYAFSIGYTYDNWDLGNVVWFPKNIKTLDGFLIWLNKNETGFTQIKAYLKAKELINSLK